MDKYTKLKKIGEGSFGKAILVKRNDNGEQFVIKEIGISRMQQKERNEARKEVIVLSKMRHPNIVQYIESFEENGFLYIVMEYCEGGDLYAMINKQRGASFRESQVLDWFVQLCLALKHVHDRKILHRDIKTSNIFLTKSGSVKLGDFGIARVLSNTMELARTCIGTPYYLSPEICENKPYNNKSDVWALGCVVYEILTLKHAFEAGNMKNLVLKIIRGSYPPVPSRYSYELRLLVSQLFRRNPRERPSVNSILKKSFISPLTERFLSPEQHEDEFSHTVLHKGRRPAPRPSSAVSGAGRYQPVAAKRLRNLEVKGVGARNAREQQLAGVYGPSVGLRKKPAPARAKVAHAQRAVGDVLEQRRQLVEAEQQRKDKLAAEKKKRLDDLQKRQQERAQRLKEEQLKRARDEARMFNLKRSSDLLGLNEDSGSGKDEAKPAAAAARDRPISAPSKPGVNYDKYHQYLDKLEKGDRLGAAQFAAPGLDKVRAAWEDRNQAQNAIMNAQVNRAVGENAANRAQVVNEYLQRKKEAMWNKQKGNNELFGVNKPKPKAGVAAALQPYVAKPKDEQEREYLDRLQKIRVQNYHDRRAVEDKIRVGKQYKVVDADQSEAGSQEQKKKKIVALQQQAADRARILQMNMQERRRMMAARSSAENKRNFENMARARGIVPPDERPVNYNPSPIGMTQALQAVGVALPEKEAEPEPCKEVEDPKEAGNAAATNPPDAAIGITQALRAVGAPIMQGVPKIPPESASPSRAGDSHLRKKILQRVNQRYSTEFGEGNDAITPNSPRKEDTQEATEAKPEKALPRPLPKVPGDAHKPEHAWKAWAPAGDIGLKIAQLPLEETASQMDATTVVNKKAAAPSKPPVPPKKQWAVPSGTFVRRLNDMPAQLPTMTMTTQDNDAQLEAGGDVKVASSGKGDTHKAGSDDTAPEAVTASPEGEGGGSDHLGSKPDHKTVVLSRKSPDLPRPKVAGPGLKGNVLLAPSFQGAKMGTYVIRKSTDASEEKPKDLPVDAKSAPSLEGPQKSSPSPRTDAPVKRRAFSEVSDDEIEEIALLEGLLAEQDDAAAAKGSGDRAAWGDEPLTPIEPHTPTKKDESAKSEASHVTGPATPPKVLTPKPSMCESPLFIKRNKHPDKMMATSPVKTPDHGKEAKSDPLSKSLYQTASDRVLMKITLGQFDSPSPKLLRTCSLPDLTAPIGDAPPDVQLSCDPPTDDLPRASVASSMNDTNFDEDEEVPNLDSDVSCHDDGSDVDDEERDMRAQLQMALRTSEAGRESSSSPGSARYSASHDLIVSSDASDDDISAGEDWESRSSGSSFEEKLSGDEAEGEEKKDAEQESIFCQLERNREQLEKDLGFDAFLRAYKCVQAIHEDEDEEVAECQSRVKDVLGERFEELYPRILRLVMADGAYCEDND